MKIAVQYYTLRNDYKTADEFLALFKKVKELGFEGIEFAGFGGNEPEKIRAALDEAGLVAVGAHYGMGNFDTPEKVKETIAVAKTLGAPTIGTGGEPHKTKEEVDRLCRIFKAANEMGEKEGVKFYYHNHYEEFQIDFDGKLCEDVIAENTYIQVDTYWSFFAGVDNYKFMTENKDRIVHIHIKDGIDGHPTALGEGNCDLKAVVKAAEDIGLEWMILENDDPTPSGLEDIARSMKYIKENLIF
ncbi:MAG: sugar phosphate isomerase/epimerase [Clostridiales bacterium]|nr:sugar phosphate isomerase/epimerase [Clostridiales bacterium]